MPTQIQALPVVDLTIITGTNEDWRDGVEFTTDGVTAINLTGIAFHSQLRRRASDPEAFIDATTANGRLINGGSDGTLAWLVLEDMMSRMAPGEYVADVLATADGVSRVVIRATVSIVEGVTR